MTDADSPVEQASSPEPAAMLGEPERARDHGSDVGAEVPSPEEAMALAAAAIRAVEAELQRAEGGEPAAVGSARQLLHAALEVLRAAMVAAEARAELPGSARRVRHRRRRRRQGTG